MSLEEKIRQLIKEYGYASAESKFLRTVLGELQLEMNRPGFKEGNALSVVKKCISGNEETLGYLSEDDDRHATLVWENELLQTFLPSYLSEDEIREHLSQIPEFSSKENNVGKLMGFAMSYFKNKNLPVEGQTVKAVIIELQ